MHAKVQTKTPSSARRKQGRPAAMANSSAEVFASHREVMEALQQNFAGGDDVQRVVSIGKSTQDLAADCQQKENNVKETISGRHRCICKHMQIQEQPVAIRSVTVQNCRSKPSTCKQQQHPNRPRMHISKEYRDCCFPVRQQKKTWIA